MLILKKERTYWPEDNNGKNEELQNVNEMEKYGM